MLYDASLLHSIIKRASFWHALNDELLHAVLLGEESTVVQFEQLLILHPLFPYSLKARLAWDARHGNISRIINRDTVCDTLELLKFGAVHFVDTDGTPHLLTSVDGLKTAERDTNVRLRGTELHVEYAQHEETGIPYITSTDWAEYEVGRHELDALYPGWSERWLVAQNLGMKASALGQYIFTKQASAGSAIRLGSITFD